MLALIFSLVLHVHAGESINAALDSARAVYQTRQERTTILLDPAVYQEELTIDVPGLSLKCANYKRTAFITWYYGHGYQYRSMGKTNYGGSRSRKWNASVLVTAPDFYAENIVFENSFNLYVSSKEAQDSLYILPEYTARPMPERPKQAGSTEVRRKQYRERAAAISFTSTATNAHLKNCTAIGRQDVVYGDQGATIYWERGTLAGGVDFIFGAMTMVVDHATIVANITDEPGEKCYVAAGRSGGDQASETPTRGLLFYHCYLRSPIPERMWLARPWRPWGETVWAYTRWQPDERPLNPEVWSTGLIKKREDFNPSNPCPNSYEYRSQDHSVGRPDWVTVLRHPRLPDGTRLTPKAWLKQRQPSTQKQPND